jgi:hypothetical protein
MVFVGHSVQQRSALTTAYLRSSKLMFVCLHVHVDDRAPVCLNSTMPRCGLVVIRQQPAGGLRTGEPEDSSLSPTRHSHGLPLRRVAPGDAARPLPGAGHVPTHYEAELI